MAGMIQQLIARLTLDHSQFSQGAQAASKSMRDLMSESTRLNRQFLRLARAGAGLLGVSAGIYGVKQALTSVVREAAGFELGLAKVSTMLEKGSMSYLPAYTREIEQLSIAYGEAASNLTDAATEILGSQIAPAHAMKVLEESVKLSKAGFAEVPTVVRAVVGVLNAYKMEASRASDVTDILWSVFDKGVITIQELSEHFGKISGLAAQSKVDLEALGAAISTLTRAGIPADIAITGLRQLLATFRNPTDEARKAAEQLGFQLNETSIQGVGLLRILEGLKEATAAQIEALMPEMRGQMAFVTAMHNIEGALRDWQTNMRDAGVAQEGWNKISAQTWLELQRTEQAWNALKRSIGRPMLPQLSQMFQTIQKYLDANRRDMEAWSKDTVRILTKTVETYLWAQREFGNLIEKAVIPRTTEKAAWARYLQYYPQDKDIREAQEQWDKLLKTRQGGGWVTPLGPRPELTNPAYLNELRQQLRKEQETVLVERERAARNLERMAPLPGTYAVPEEMETPEVPDGPTLPPADNTGRISYSTGKAREEVAKLTQEMQKNWRTAMDMTDAQKEASERLVYASLVGKAYRDNVQEQTRLLRNYDEMLQQIHDAERIENQQKFNEEFAKEIQAISFEITLLGKTNRERQIALALENARREAAWANVEFIAAQEEALRHQMERLQKMESIAEVGEIVGRGLTDAMRDVTEALVENGDAWEALRQTALNVIANIQEKLVFRPMEDLLTSFATQAIGAVVGAGANWLGGGSGANVAPSTIEGFDKSGLLPRAAGGVVPQYLATGGIVGRDCPDISYARTAVYAAQGVFQPQGTDTVPAMLTPGELVIPKDMTDWLRQALAAGSTPVYRAVGGVVAQEPRIPREPAWQPAAPRGAGGREERVRDDRHSAEIVALLRQLVAKETSFQVYTDSPRRFLESREGEKIVARHAVRNGFMQG